MKRSMPLARTHSFKPRQQPLARTTALPPRTARLAPQSPAARATSAQQQRVYQQIPEDDWCAACGRSGPVEHSHILTQHQHPKHRSNPLNWLMLCRTCHACWEDNKGRFKLQYPAAFAEKVRRMELLDRQAAAFFKIKHENLFK